MAEDEFKKNISRYMMADDRMTGYFKESDSYEEWLLKCRADEDVSDYIGYMIDLGMKSERDLYRFFEKAFGGPKFNLTTWAAGDR
jgi:hypothetical protein